MGPEERSDAQSEEKSRNVTEPQNIISSQNTSDHDPQNVLTSQNGMSQSGMLRYPHYPSVDFVPAAAVHLLSMDGVRLEVCFKLYLKNFTKFQLVILRKFNSESIIHYFGIVTPSKLSLSCDDFSDDLSDDLKVCQY